MKLFFIVTSFFLFSLLPFPALTQDAWMIDWETLAVKVVTHDQQNGNGQTLDFELHGRVVTGTINITTKEPVANIEEYVKANFSHLGSKQENGVVIITLNIIEKKILTLNGEFNKS